jgi:hypothetical protein
MLTITVAYVIDLSCVAIHRSFLGSKPQRTTEIDRLSDPPADEISPRIAENACEMPAALADKARSHLSERRDLDHTQPAIRKALRRVPSVCCQNIRSESGT